MTCQTIYGNIQGCPTPITLPGSQGPTGATGSTGVAGTSLLCNNNNDTNSTTSLTPQIMEQYTMVNAPTETLPDDGDAVEITTQLDILAGVTGTFYIEFGAGTTVSEYNIPVSAPLLADTNMILSVFVTRTGASAQVSTGKATILGQPDSSKTSPVAINGIDLTSNVVITVYTNKDTNVGAGDVICKNLRIFKYKI